MRARGAFSPAGLLTRAAELKRRIHKKYLRPTTLLESANRFKLRTALDWASICVGTLFANWAANSILFQLTKKALHSPSSFLSKKLKGTAYVWVCTGSSTLMTLIRAFLRKKARRHLNQ
jgi:hypothetical protein